MAFCNNCSSKIDRNWNFCPNCGNRLSRRVNLNEIINRQMNYFKKILDISSYDISIQPQSDNTFVVNISQGFKKEPSLVSSDEHKHYSYKKSVKQMKMPKKVVEPDAVVRGGRSNFMVEVELPGVKNEKNVEIVRMNNSIEIRAKEGKLGYFKILKIPGKHRLLKKELDKEKLFLEFSV